MMGPIERILRDAAELHTKSPCQGHFAEGPDGMSVPPTDSRAVRFCMLGAIKHIDGRDGYRYRYGHDAEHILEDVCERLLGGGVPKLNDGYPDLAPDAWSEAVECAHELEKAGKL